MMLVSLVQINLFLGQYSGELFEFDWSRKAQASFFAGQVKINSLHSCSGYGRNPNSLHGSEQKWVSFN